MKTYLFSYTYRGGRYSFEIPADSFMEAKDRLCTIQTSGTVDYDGELMAKIPAFYGTGLFVRLLTWWKNL